MGTSSIITIIIAVIAIILVLKLLSGLLRLGISVAIIGFVAYYLYTNFFSGVNTNFLN